ncbi:hypothetical protein [Streptomyces tsukubensis]|uniref:hypothetical protein n=1 Tax=Streptomyces tsukubensis TaxID=83656 RepID=UPI00344FB1E0
MNGTKYEDFALWVRRRALRAGYALDVPRSGAVSELSADVGTAIYNVSRVLNAHRIPAYGSWSAWAAALGVSEELFRRKAKAALRGQ